MQISGNILNGPKSNN